MKQDILKSIKIIIENYENTVEKRYKAVERALELWPENPLGIALKRLKEADNVVGEIRFLEDMIANFPKERNELAALQRHVRKLLFFVYCDVGLERKAANYGSELLKQHKDYSSIASKLAVVYCKLYEIDVAEKLYYDYKLYQDVEVLVPLVVFSVLSDYGDTEEYMGTILRSAPAIEEIFTDLYYDENIDFSFLPRKQRELTQYIYYEFNEYSDYLEKEYCYNKIKSIVDDIVDTDFDLAETLQNMEFYSHIDNDVYNGLPFNIKRIFIDQELLTVEDFNAKTEKEILALKGIGPVTIKKLKNNGVIFRKVEK